MQKWKLVNKEGREIKPGDTVTDFRGETAYVSAALPPKHENSSGHVATIATGHTCPSLHFPSVYGLKFVQEPEQ